MTVSRLVYGVLTLIGMTKMDKYYCVIPHTNPVRGAVLFDCCAQMAMYIERMDTIIYTVFVTTKPVIFIIGHNIKSFDTLDEARDEIGNDGNFCFDEPEVPDVGYLQNEFAGMYGEELFKIMMPPRRDPKYKHEPIVDE